MRSVREHCGLKDAGCSVKSESTVAAALTGQLYEFDYGCGTSMGRVLVGVDEVGRGPLAGPVVAAAVILDPDTPIQGINSVTALRSLATRWRWGLRLRMVTGTA